VADEEDLVRFLIQSNQFNATGIKPAAFLPSPKDRETSVFRHGGRPAESLWTVGDTAANGRTLHGAAVINAKSVREGGLEVESSEPPPFHAVILRWPWLENDVQLQKARQKEIAAVLASRARLVIRA
jgi:hypothetical protein